ncbi:hypothetical protein PG994_014326 [Apiospora phragmitis]|uniref:Uncharacterized protein n=1 Tax=Apiospora phragmitis TaxID=2905665 RepID=A0ABR1T407_9PEZI
MQYPLDFNPSTPPQQTAGYHPTPTSSISTPPQQQQYRYPPQQQQIPQPMMPGPHPPAPPQHYQPQPQMMPAPQQNTMNPMEAWYNSIPEPQRGPLHDSDPPHAWHPVLARPQFYASSQYMMYIATKKWKASPYAATTFPNFAAMPLPSLSIKQREQMAYLRECFDTGRFPGDMCNHIPLPSNNNQVAGNNNASANGNAAAAAPTNNNCCHHHCCGNHAAAPPANGNNGNNSNNGNNGNQAAAGPASAPSSSSEEEEDPEARRHQEWVDHAWFDIFGQLYPPTRRFAADRFWSERDCRILAIMESKYWAEFSAQFCNATGRYVAPEHIQYKMETDGMPIIGSDDDEGEGDGEDDADYDDVDADSSSDDGDDEEEDDDDDDDDD